MFVDGTNCYPPMIADCWTMADKIGEEIGRGAFGVVVKATDISSSVEVAIKISRFSGTSGRITREEEVLQRVREPCKEGVR
jgi:serine/threonine protein kinase